MANDSCFRFENDNMMEWNNENILTVIDREIGKLIIHSPIDKFIFNSACFFCILCDFTQMHLLAPYVLLFIISIYVESI